MYIPKTIISGKIFHYNRYLDLKIGQYYQVHEEDTQRNSHSYREKSAIFLRPSGNTQGVFKFMSLHSAKNITRRVLGAIPITDTVIARVNELAKVEP